MPVAPGAAAAAQAHCGFVLPCLRVLAEPLRACEPHVSPLLSTWAEANAASDPSDVAMVQSLPGVGRTSTAWLFAEAAQSLAGTGLSRVAHAWGESAGDAAKWEAPPGGEAARLSPTLAPCPLPYGAGGEATEAHCASVYEALRAKGQRHGQALRHLAARLRLS